MAKLEEAPAPRLEGEIATVTLGDARRIIAAAEKKAEELGERMNIAVVDVGGNMVAHVRMDGGCIGSIDVSMKKGVHLERV